MDSPGHQRSDSSTGIIDKLEDIVPAPLARFDAFPKLPSTYKARSESRGLLTIFVTLCAFILVLNDFGEYLWGWPMHEFSIDHDRSNDMNINVDMIVNMPCQCESSSITTFTKYFCTFLRFHSTP